MNSPLFYEKDHASLIAFIIMQASTDLFEGIVLFVIVPLLHYNLSKHHNEKFQDFKCQFYAFIIGLIFMLIYNTVAELDDEI